MENELNKLELDDTVYRTRFTKKFELRKSYQPVNKNEIRAFIPGIIRDIYVKPGDYVHRGDKLLVLEAMKMKNRIFSPVNGKVKKVCVKSDQKVAKNDLLIELEVQD